jgi:hypothetical protein
VVSAATGVEQRSLPTNHDATRASARRLWADRPTSPAATLNTAIAYRPAPLILDTLIAAVLQLEPQLTPPDGQAEHVGEVLRDRGRRDLVELVAQLARDPRPPRHLHQ